LRLALALQLTTSGIVATSGTMVGAGLAITNNFANAQKYDFKGKQNDGNITASATLGQLNLVGNPIQTPFQ